MMLRAIRKYSRDFSAIVVLVALASAVAAYVLSNQRLRFPLLQAAPLRYKADFSTAQAVTPGQGQTVRVSGVRVGEISDVSLRDGHAIVAMAIDPQFKGLIRTDAGAFLRPKTGLKDMFIELNPGTRRAPAAAPGWTIPLARTQPDVNPDEIFQALDADTRDYLKLLLRGAGEGLRGRGHDLQTVFRLLEPTHRDLARTATLLARRHASLEALIHALRLLNGELAGRAPQLSLLVRASNAVLHSFAGEQAGLGRAVGELPGTLRASTGALGEVHTLADTLAPAAERLRPAARALTRASGALLPLGRELAPVIATQLRPFVRDARPLARSLAPPARDLAAAAPDLKRVFVVVNHLLNLLAYNPSGHGDRLSDPARDEGYLFYTAWLAHNALAVFNSADANGTFRNFSEEATCGTLKATLEGEAPQAKQALAYVTGLLDVLLDPAICGGK